MLLGLGGAGVVLADDDSNGILRRHAWARFQPGSWKLVRTVTDTVDADGSVISSSTTETRTTLVAIGRRTITLRVEAAVEVGGKKLEAPPQEAAQGLEGEPPEQIAAPKQIGSDNVAIGGQCIPCRVVEREMVGPETKTVIKTWQSSNVEPYVLKRAAYTTALEGNSPLYETSMEVVVLRAPRRVLNRLRDVSELKVVHRQPKGKTVTSAWTCGEVPGGIVAQKSQEFDTDDKLVRRSTLELVDYEAK
jgi:hypothetical protein